MRITKTKRKNASADAERLHLLFSSLAAKWIYPIRRAAATLAAVPRLHLCLGAFSTRPSVRSRPSPVQPAAAAAAVVGRTLCLGSHSSASANEMRRFDSIRLGQFRGLCFCSHRSNNLTANVFALVAAIIRHNCAHTHSLARTPTHAHTRRAPFWNGDWPRRHEHFSIDK